MKCHLVSATLDISWAFKSICWANDVCHMGDIGAKKPINILFDFVNLLDWLSLLNRSIIDFIFCNLICDRGKITFTDDEDFAENSVLLSSRLVYTKAFVLIVPF